MFKFRENPLRKLANSNYYQTLYTRCKEIGSLQLFDNKTDLSNHQIIMLQWLHIYNILYDELANGADFLNEEVIKDEIRTDAYLYYRKKRRENKLYDEQEQKHKKTDNNSGLPSIRFTRSTKK